MSSLYALLITFFCSGWDFFTGNDPTNGNVEYLSRSAAAAAGLAYVQSDGTTVLAVDSKSQVAPGGKRKSVRISTKDTYNDGLFIADFWKMPHGDTLWPAYWSTGPQWPENGEIDIIEYVNLATNNQYTLHSGSGSDCKLDPNAPGIYKNASGQVEAFLGHVMGTQCQSSEGSNAGCAFSDPGDNSIGSAFNQASGGVFAHLWDSTQVSIWRFPRNAIPQDITDGTPDPSNWGVPIAYWSGDSCDLSTHFRDHTIVIDTTICGGWASSAYSAAGHSGSCSDAVANATNYKWGMWKIGYIAIYGAS